VRKIFMKYQTMVPNIRRARVQSILLGVLLIISAGSAGAAASSVSQTPLSVAGGVPGNLILTPSVEWPTVDSVANIATAYVPATRYTGYFDSGKCYKYNYSITEANRHFFPFSITDNGDSSITAADHDCDPVTKQWSGNYLNWATTQTIDPFRKGLTGGYRSTDTVTVTILEKARSDASGGGSIFPDRNITGGVTLAASVPAQNTPTWTNFRTRIGTLGNKMRFTDSGSLGNAPTAYDPAAHTLTNGGGSRGTVYEVSIRVKVCDPTVGVESNCVQYGANWKPEGLIQKYSSKIRYSVFGYLNDPITLRDGAALRARQKFVGPQLLNPTTHALEDNPAKEWNPTTGVLFQNPDSADATATTTAVGATSPINDSGVINYLNKFGQMTTANHKSYDPVSEMYYAALRYIRNKSNIAAYTSLSGTAAQRYQLADGFPVITAWTDPLQYSCQNNAILGIGDVNTHRDQNLPGALTRAEEPAIPAEVSNAAEVAEVNVHTWLSRVAAIEGITIPTNPEYSGRRNSAYMAGLAYYAHTSDLRSEVSMPGKQSVSTHWVDVRENQILEAKSRNQFYMAAKFGGFNVPDEYNSLTNTAALPNSWWTKGDLLTTGDLRPTNFYVASEAGQMVQSLTSAFAKIASESVGSASSLAANSTRLDTDTRTFQAQFSSSWSGELKAFAVAADGSLSAAPVWTASTTTSLAPANWAARKIYFHKMPGDVLLPFTHANLSATQQGYMGASAAEQTGIVNYIRGDISKEEAQTNGIYRTRPRGLLGDIVNSTPVFVSKPNPVLYDAAMGFPGAASYQAFAAAQATRNGVIWVGSNDGMLHGFDADDGQELYAFIPKSVISGGIKDYASPDYEHKYFVDGDIAVADVYNGAVWKTILVGTMGRGGPGVFALDVTNPTAAGITLLWDHDAADIPELGHNLGKPVIAQTASGVWNVLIGNGPDSASTTAKLIAINVFSGTAATISTGGAANNGLSAVLARDTNGDRLADTAYAGDLTGRLLKISALGGTPSVSTIFNAVDPVGTAQPITAAPLAGRDPATGKTWVLFGTGKYFSDSDPDTSQVQTWYGIQDTGVTPTRLTLTQRSATTIAGSPTVRTVTAAVSGDLAGKLGWYLDLPSARERMVVPNLFQGGALIGTSRIPDTSNVCQPSGKGFVMAIDPFTGARLEQTFFDINGDGLFNDSDKATVAGTLTIVSGVGFDSSPNAPIFVENVMQVSLDDGTTRTIRTQGSSVDSRRLGWREIRN
jgi:type IV pilus assembly protein PilY1